MAEEWTNTTGTQGTGLGAGPQGASWEREALRKEDNNCNGERGRQTAAPNAGGHWMPTCGTGIFDPP